MNSQLLGPLALLVVVTAGVLWFRAVRGVRLPWNRTGFVSVFLAAAALAVAAFMLDVGWTRIPAGIAIFGAGFFLFSVSISRQKLASDAISVGATLPEFSAVDGDGETFESASLAGRPVLLKFFRGHW